MQAADHEVFHDASLGVKASMDVNISSLDAWSKVRPWGEIISKFKLDPSRVNVFVLSRIETLFIWL